MYRIEKLDHKGKGITFVDGKITFVSGSLPSEIVDIRLIVKKKKFNEATLCHIIQKSVDRVIPECAYFEECGGCDLIHLNYSKQLEYKLEKVKEILKRYGDIDFDVKDVIYSNQFNYRNKATFQVKETIGFFKKKSYEIIGIDQCFIADRKINEILNEVKRYDLSGIDQIVIRVSKYTNDSMIIFKTNHNLNFDTNEINCNNIIMYKNNEYITLKGNGYLIEKLNDLNFMISPGSFFQVNSLCAVKLYEKVLEFACLKKENNILDLFCGTGTIGLYLSRFCNHVTGVEINQYAVEDAKKNALLNKIHNIDFTCDDAINVRFKNLDLVIVDPPRSGLDKVTVKYLLNLNVKKIIYVSCDPMTLARDLKLLKEKYDVKNICLVDMFPNTYHVESVVLLQRKN